MGPDSPEGHRGAEFKAVDDPLGLLDGEAQDGSEPVQEKVELTRGREALEPRNGRDPDEVRAPLSRERTERDPQERVDRGDLQQRGRVDRGERI